MKRRAILIIGVIFLTYAIPVSIITFAFLDFRAVYITGWEPIVRAIYMVYSLIFAVAISAGVADFLIGLEDK